MYLCSNIVNSNKVPNVVNSENCFILGLKAKDV